MESATKNSQTKASKDENDAPASYGNQSETTQYSEDPAQVEAVLVPHLEKMFEIDNVKASNYLINRLNANMEIKVHAIYKERSVQEITQDNRIIEAALQKCKNIEYLPESKAIRLKTTTERKTILVKGIPAAKETDFCEFVEKLCEKDEKMKQCKISYDKKTECASLTFPDEGSTIKIFSELMNTKFQENQIDCIIKDSNAYIELLETSKNPRGGMGGGPGYFPYQSNYYQKPMYNYPPQYQPMYMMMPPNGFPGNNYYQGYDKGNWGGYRGPSGYSYRGGKPHYGGGRKYERNEGDEGNQNEETGEYRGEKREYRGERREYGGDKKYRGGYSRRGNHEKKPQRTKEEMDKITAVDDGNYPPLS